MTINTRINRFESRFTFTQFAVEARDTSTEDTLPMQVSQHKSPELDVAVPHGDLHDLPSVPE
jgi:hypothetical protein